MSKALARVDGSNVVLSPPGATETVIPGRWLRDHGDDPGSVDPDSHQRVVDTFSIPRDVAPLELTQSGDRLAIAWSGGASTSNSLADLMAIAGNRRGPAPTTGVAISIDPDLKLWSSPHEISLLPAVALDDDGLWRDALVHLHRHGWVMFDDVELGKESVERLGSRLGYVRRTIFGDIWTLSPDVQDHLDSAYTTVEIEVHTDCTYTHDAPGLMVFAQQERGGDGGDSVLVDGFAAARDFAARQPEAADLLTRFDIRGRYVEPGVNLVSERPPLRVDAGGVLRQVSFNNYDRAPVLPDEEWVDDVIDAYADFHSVLVEPDRALRLPWQPGRVLIFDNWRLLHGRTSYSGARSFLGFYANHEDLESTLRLHGLS